MSSVRALYEHLRLGPMTAGAKRGLLYLVGLGVLVNAGAYILNARSVNELRAQQHAECKFDSDLGGAPVAVNPATGKPSVLGITIVSDARVAWHIAGCPGTLMAADPTFIRWARYYRVPAN